MHVLRPVSTLRSKSCAISFTTSPLPPKSQRPQTKSPAVEAGILLSLVTIKDLLKKLDYFFGGAIVTIRAVGFVMRVILSLR